MALKTLHFDRGNALAGNVKNTGKKKQDTYGATVKYALAKEGFGFASYEDARDLTKIREAIINKDIAVLFDVNASENSNVEASFFEEGNIKQENKYPRKGLIVRHRLGLFSHSALKSYENSEYSRIIEFTRDNNMLMVFEDELLKGQLMSNFIVNPKIEPVIEGEPPTTSVEIIYHDFNDFEDKGQVIRPNHRLSDLEGIYDLEFEFVTATATNLQFYVSTLDGTNVNNLTSADLLIDNAAIVGTFEDGTTTNGLYSITGTGYVSGVINTTGVLDKTKKLYEGVEQSFTVV